VEYHQLSSTAPRLPKHPDDLAAMTPLTTSRPHVGTIQAKQQAHNTATIWNTVIVAIVSVIPGMVSTITEKPIDEKIPCI